ncbi:hypothetical protein GGR50DRAFT_234253 [Xylaria sp. CBS 124048]|nr:hypothetical protein GGR50DRAFT_234253 [Xylaria sp. CBS 124048]
MARRGTRSKRNAASVKGDWNVLPHGMGVRPAVAKQPENPTIGDRQASDLNGAENNDHAPQQAPAELEESKQNNLTPAANSIADLRAEEEVTGAQAEINNDAVVDPSPGKTPGATRKSKKRVSEGEPTPLRRSKRVRAQINAQVKSSATVSAAVIADSQLDGEVIVKEKDETEDNINTPGVPESQDATQSVDEQATQDKVAENNAINDEVIKGAAIEEEIIKDTVVKDELIRDAVMEEEAMEDAVIEEEVMEDEDSEDDTVDIVAIKSEGVKNEVAQKVAIKDEPAQDEVSKDDASEEKKPALRRSTRTRTQVTQVKTEEDHKAEGETVKTRTRRVRQEWNDGIDDMELKVKSMRVAPKSKDNPYGLTPGKSPFPNWDAPSAAQCEEVYALLAEMHGKLEPPEVIPTPSLEVAGCGEVPFVLEALLRTLLSGAVTMDGAGKMVQGIISKFGVLQDELAKGSIDWNKVRLSPIEELQAAIRAGGLAGIKAKAIKATLDMVHDENIKRRDAFLAEKMTGVTADVYGASERTQGQKDLEILKTDRNILSLDHMYGLPVDDAMREFTKFPGVGVKTAACVILFCLQRPCFAVDTHVHRFSRWLGWVPNKADENDTYGHLEVHCPDRLKYGLHQLFIKHGQTCNRCKLATVEGTREWEAVVCPLEHLVARGKRATKVQKKPKARKRTKADPKEEDSEQENPEADDAVTKGVTSDEAIADEAVADEDQVENRDEEHDEI